MTAVIEVEHAGRHFGQVVALADVSLEIEPGVVGLLGPNGAGKSTLLKLLTGQLRPTRGQVRVLGMDPFANPDLYRRIGLCPEQEAVFEDLTGFEFVSFLTRMRGWDPAEADRRARAWLDRMGLAEAANRRLGGYSKGMRQRAKLATAMVHDPELLFLDEPLTGLDPVWRHRILGAVHEAAERGATVVFSSHVLHEVEAATREIVLLYHGNLLAQGDARHIRGLIDQVPHRVRIDCDHPRELAVRLMAWESVESVRVLDGGVHVTTPAAETFYAELTRAAAADELGIAGYTSPDDSLGALFETLVK